MIALGAHGMYLTDWILGEPISYASAFTHFCRDEEDAKLNPSGIEDNAVTVMSFENGAVAVNETGFVSSGSPLTFEIGGDKGYLIGTPGSVTFTGDGKPAALELPEREKHPLACFLEGIPAEGCGIDEAIVLTKMMCGAYKSIK